jgi:hypothetical protein
MIRRWLGAAAVAGWLGLGAAAHAQYLPSTAGAARIMPEPMPCGPGGGAPPAPQPNLIPGPLTTETAPPGPCPDLSLPANHMSAFQCENWPPDCAFYVNVGAMALQRQQLGKGAVAVFDDFAGGLDTGTPGIPFAPVAQRFKDVVPGMDWGLRGTVGYIFGDQAVELTAWGTFMRSQSQLVDNPGNIDVFFHNPPLGFEGDNGLWLQADRVTTTFMSGLFNGELNYRCWNGGIHGLEFIAGVRYLDQREKLSIYTNDDDLTLESVGRPPDPRRTATYAVATHNHILAPQIGVDYTWPLLCWLWLGFDGKAGVGPNWVNTNITLDRGDGFNGINDHHIHVGVSQVYEVGAFVDFHILERMRLRGGYMGLWMVDVATSQDQVDFNLANTGGRKNYTGSIFYHGPLVELQFLF